MKKCHSIKFVIKIPVWVMDEGAVGGHPEWHVQSGQVRRPGSGVQRLELSFYHGEYITYTQLQKKRTTYMCLLYSKISIGDSCVI